MRNVISHQPESGKTQLFGVTLIDEIEFDPRCRDEVTKFLRGAQALYMNVETRHAVRAVLEKMIPEGVNLTKGRKGMDLWSIFVLGMLRLTCNWDYDKLKNCFDNHRQVRQMASIDLFCEENKFISLQTIHDNVSLFTTEISNEISDIVVQFSHQNLFPKMTEIHAKCDSFVFLSNVHFPTDFNLLLDSIRKVITLCSNSAKVKERSGWREYESLFEKGRSCYNKLSKMRNSNSKKQDVKEKRTAEIHNQIKISLEFAERIFVKAKLYQGTLDEKVSGLDVFLKYGELFTNQINRRVFNDEKIPQEEKVLSIFEPYTEWICKGKAGVRQELGVKFGIIQDQHGFLLSHRMMYKVKWIPFLGQRVRFFKIWLN